MSGRAETGEPSEASVFGSRLFLLAVLLTVALRLPYVVVPYLIVDEAQMLAYGAYIAETGAVYGDGFSDMRGPGAYYFHAFLYLIFGFSNLPLLHAFGIVYQLLIVVLVARFGNAVFGPRIAALGSLFYAIFSFAYLAHEMIPLNVAALTVPLLLGGALACLRIVESHGGAGRVALWCVIAGLLTGLAFGIKQVVGIALAVYALVLLIDGWRAGRFLTALVVPYALLWVGFFVGFGLMYGPSIFAGEGADAYYWSVRFGFEHYAGTLASRFFYFAARLFLLLTGQPLLWLCGFAWLGAMAWRLRAGRGEVVSIGRLLCAAMVVAQMLGAFVAGHAAGHYFIPVIAFLALGAAEVAQGALDATRRRDADGSRPLSARGLIELLLVAGLALPTLNYLVFPEGVRLPIYSSAKLFEEKRAQDSPFDRAAGLIREHTSEADPIYQIGGYDLYVLAGRVPATNPLTFEYYAEHERSPELEAYYQARIAAPRVAPPKAIVVPSWTLGGMPVRAPYFRAVAELLDAHYAAPVRFSWDQRLKFWKGKLWMQQRGETESVDVYLRRDVR